MNEEQDFLRCLRGEPVSTSDPYLQTCAQVIREAMNHSALYQPPPLTPERVDAFRAKLRQGRSPAVMPMGKVEVRTNNTWWRHAKWSLPLTASVLLGVGVVRIGMDLTSNEFFPATRVEVASRSIDGKAVTLVTDPETSMRNLQARLAALEIDAQVTSQGALWQLEAFVPESKESQVNQLLQTYQLAVSKNGSLSIAMKKP